jgi:hypothetical protein
MKMADAFIPTCTDPKTVFRITFGQRYRTEQHPTGEWITPDGYVVIVADSEEAARAKADEVFGKEGWSMIYDYLDIENGRFNPDDKHYELGVLAVYFV